MNVYSRVFRWNSIGSVHVAATSVSVLALPIQRKDTVVKQRKDTVVISIQLYALYNGTDGPGVCRLQDQKARVSITYNNTVRIIIHSHL